MCRECDFGLCSFCSKIGLQDQETVDLERKEYEKELRDQKINLTIEVDDKEKIKIMHKLKKVAEFLEKVAIINTKKYVAYEMALPSQFEMDISFSGPLIGFHTFDSGGIDRPFQFDFMDDNINRGRAALKRRK